MHIATPINKDRLRNHLNYGLCKYALVLVLAIAGWSIVFDMTEPRSPQDKRIDVYVQANTASSDTIDAFLAPIWHEVTPEMEEVSSVALTVIDEYTSYMQLYAYIAAGEGDIYFLNEQYFKSFAAGEAFLPLEALVADGTLNVSDVDLSKGYITLRPDEDEERAEPATHLYGIPLDSFYGFMKGMQIDNRGLYAVVLVNNMNDENVIPFFNALLQAGRGEKEAWID